MQLKFEEPLPTGLTGDAPTADVALELGDGRYVAIESKYAEWLVRRPRSQRAFKDKYFPKTSDGGVWAAAGLPRCQALAEDLQAGRERCNFLHAPQLLEARAGFGKERPRQQRARLPVLRLARREKPSTHRSELERVVARLAPELDLRVLTYQALFGSLRAASGVDTPYLDYLAERYFA